LLKLTKICFKTFFSNLFFFLRRFLLCFPGSSSTAWAVV
jgi:hypothetical protein